MSFASTTGIYTPASGALTATAGQVIASATWNGINADYTAALTTLGKASIPVLTTGISNTQYATAPVQCNFAAAGGTDIGTFPLPTITNLFGFRIVGMQIFGASGTLNSAVVSLYTAASAGGVQIISSVATTVTSSVAGNNNSLQVMTPSNANTQSFSATNLFLHVTTSTSTSNLAWVQVLFIPLIT